MTRVLRFPPNWAHAEKTSLRRARFEQQSTLPLSAACVTANGIREVASQLLARSVEVSLMEPIVPDSEAWPLLCAGALAFTCRGTLGEATMMLQPADALVLVAASLGETSPQELRPLSAIESEILERVLGALGSTLGAVCGGRENALFRRGEPPRRCASYFELALSLPAKMRLGVALSQDTPTTTQGALAPEALLSAVLPLRVRVASGTLAARRLLTLKTGDVIPLETRIDSQGALLAGSTAIASGECGALRGERAFVVGGIAR